MKKTAKILICVTLLVALAVSLAACGYSGRYELAGMTAMGQTIRGSALDAALTLAGESREDYYIEFSFFGTGTVVTPDETLEFKYKDNTLWGKDNPDEKLSFTMEDGVVTITIGFAELIFEK